MSPKIKEVICRYGFGVAITLAITWLRVLMAETLEDRVPFGLHYISILTTAWLCGTGPACIALLLGLVLSTYSPNSSFELHDPGDLLSLALYSIVGVVAIGLIRRSEREHDQSQQKATECEAMSTELAAADRRKDEFLALLAHELRNPLATLVSGVEAVDRSDADVEKRSAVLDSMRRQLRQLVVLVDDLLDVSRYLRGSLSLVREPTDLREAIDAAIEVARPLIEHKEHELCFTRPLVPLAVDADLIRLTQVIVNLLTNAAKYTPKRGRIHVLCETTDERIILHVVDNGIGISEDSHRAIFELFTQVNSSATRDGEGLGIGLALVKQLVERHDGQIRIASEGPGHGSRFTVELPKIDRALLQPRDPAESNCAADPVETTGKRLLVIDDNADAAKTLAALLELEGYEVAIAYDGHTGIRLAGELRPETILLDIGMPGLDGYEVARQIRASALTPSPRIIAVSGWGSDLDRRRSKEAGFDAHLTKPVQFDQLTEAITSGEHAHEAEASC